MKIFSQPLRKGFTLVETVIAIGVLAVLITVFLAVFGPAASGIKYSIDYQQADRMVATLEKELVTLRTGQEIVSIPSATTGFEKAFYYIKQSNGTLASNSVDNALLIYQYRGSLSSVRPDGTSTPFKTTDGIAGKDYTMQAMMRRKNDPELLNDMEALEGPVFCVRCQQTLLLPAGSMQPTTNLNPGYAGAIYYYKKGATAAADMLLTVANTPAATAYQDATLSFKADFFILPSFSAGYLSSNSFQAKFRDVNSKPVFSRNLAVRR